MTSGFFYNTAKMSKSGDYKTIKNQHTVYIHPSSVLAKQEVCLSQSIVCVSQSTVNYSLVSLSNADDPSQCTLMNASEMHRSERPRNLGVIIEGIANQVTRCPPQILVILLFTI